MRLEEIGEFELIRSISEQPQYNKVILGIGDDCAVLPLNQEQYQLITCDLLVENTHFLWEHISPYELGYKSVAVNLSDIAAMGGTPTNILISLALPAQFSVEDWNGFYCGVEEICKQYEVNVIGGDTTASEHDIIVNITAIGTVKIEHLRLRSHAKIGDLIFVTGPLGVSRAGLELILRPIDNVDEDTARYLKNKHHMPEPCCREVDCLNHICGESLHSLNDISDGLVSECEEIAHASQVGMLLYMDQIPIDDNAKKLAHIINQSALQWALTGGEDYQLVGTISVADKETIEKQYFEKMGKRLYFIGEVIQEQGVFAKVEKSISKLISKGYVHFK